MPTQQIKGTSQGPVGKVDLNLLITHFTTPAFALVKVSRSKGGITQSSIK